MKSEKAILKKIDENYSIFQVDDMCIKFYTSPHLLEYCRIIKWMNSGYIEYEGRFDTSSELIEDSIDLAFIADRLHLPKDVFEGIKEVELQ